MRKILAIVAIASGVGLIVLPFAVSLFERAAAGERVTDRFRSTMSVQGLHDLKTNFATMGALTTEFIHETSPALAHQLHMTSAEYNAYVAQNFPAVAAGESEIPPLAAFVSPVAAQLEALHRQFASIDSLPFLGLPLTTIPWILLGLGIVLVGLGVLVLRVRSRGPVWLAAALGVGMLVLPLVLSYPQKTADAKKVVAIGRVALSAQAIAGAEKANRLIDEMVAQVNTSMVPAVARRLHVRPAAFKASIAHNFPAVAKGLAAWGSIKPGAVELVRRQAASVHDGTRMNGLHFTPLPWYIMGPGIVLLLAAAGALISRSERQKP